MKLVLLVVLLALVGFGVIAVMPAAYFREIMPPNVLALCCLAVLGCLAAVGGWSACGHAGVLAGSLVGAVVVVASAIGGPAALAAL